MTLPSIRRRSSLGSALRSSLKAVALLCSSHTALAQTATAETTGRVNTDSKGVARSDGPATSAGSRLDADAVFEAGVAAYRRGDYSAARDAFTLAYEQDPSYRTAAVLGQTEEKLGHLPQAATLLNWAMFHLDPSVEPEAKARIQADLALLKERVVTLKLETPVQFQEVLIDDLVFTTNSLRILAAGEDKWTIYLEPTKHDVTVRSEGYHPQQRQVEGAPGQLLDWELRWSPLSPPNLAPAQLTMPTQPPAAIAPEHTPTQERSNEWQLPVALATSGLALVAAGFGVYSLHKYNVASDKFEEARATLQAANLRQPCGATAPVSTRNACQAVAAADQESVTHGNRAIATFTAAGALALTSTAFWLWWWNNSAKESASASWYFAPRIGQSDWGGVVQYQY